MANNNGTRESYVILVGGGLAVALIFLFGAQPRPGGRFLLDGAVCPAVAVRAWLDAKVLEGKITAAERDSFLSSGTDLGAWIRSHFVPGGLTIADVYALARSCS